MKNEKIRSYKKKLIKKKDNYKLETNETVSVDYTDNLNMPKLDGDTIVKLNSYDIKNIKRLKELNQNNHVIMQLPTIASKEDMLLIRKTIKEAGINKILITNIYGFAIEAKEKYVDYHLNIANQYATYLLNEFHIEAVEESIEFPLENTTVKKLNINRKKALMTIRSELKLTVLELAKRKYKVVPVQVKNSYFEIYVEK